MNHGLKACLRHGMVLVAALGMLCSSLSGGASAQVPAPAPAAPDVVRERPGLEAPAQPPHVGASEAAKPRLQIAWEDRLLTLDVAETDVHDVIKAISEKTGVAIDIYEGVTGKVSMHEEKAPLEKVVDDLLSAIGQRNYLMVFDGGGLTKMSIVPKGSGGAGLSEAAKRVRVKGKLRTGKELEYYPGEIIVGVNARYRSKQPETFVDGLVKDLEKKHGMSLIRKRKVSGLFALTFRIHGGRDVIAVMYDLLTDPTMGSDFEYVTPNGIGPAALEMPADDFQPFEWTDEDIAAARLSGIGEMRYMMQKYPFLKSGDLAIGREGRMVNRQYVDKNVQVYVSRTDTERLPYDDVLVYAARLGGIMVDHARVRQSELYTFLFPLLEGEQDYVAVIKKLEETISPIKRSEYTLVGPLPWINGLNGVPNDPEYLGGSQWNLVRLRATYGWDIQRACTSTVAVIDGGIDPTHIEFGSRVSSESRDFTGSGDILDDGSSHGTHVAGILGAQTDNLWGIAGVAGGWWWDPAAPAAQILALKVHFHEYNGSYWDEWIEAVHHAIGKAQVINMSFEWYKVPIFAEVLADAYESGLALVGAAGNYGSTIDELSDGYGFPPGFQNKILVVAATDEQDLQWNDGPKIDGLQSNMGRFVSVSAPGRNIVSTLASFPYYGVKSGTSMAAPHVAGLAALLFSKGLTRDAVYETIKNTTSEVFKDTALAGLMGTGRINMYSALRGSRDTEPPTKPTDSRLILEASDVKVTWRPSTDDDAIGEYAVLRRGTSGALCSQPESILGTQYCRLARVFADGTNDASGFTSSFVDGTYSFVDGSVVPGDYYYYRLVAYDKTGNPSVPTDEMDTVPPGRPTNPKALGGNGSAKFTWVAPTTNADDSPLNDLAGYRVYYSANPADPSPSWEATTQESLVLTGLANETTYFLWVAAVDETGNESELSSMITVRPEYAIWVHKAGGPSGSHTTIDEALAAARAGSIKTVMVGPGVYPAADLRIGPEPYNYDSTNITLMSERGPKETTIDGTDNSEFVVQASKDSRIIGFTIRHSSQEGGGIRCSFDSGVLIANNVFLANSIGVYIGGPMGGTDATAIGVYNNVFYGNVTGLEDTVDFSEHVRVYNNIFERNSYAIGLYQVDGCEIQYNNIYGNDHGDGVRVYIGYENKILHNPSCPSNFVDPDASQPDFHLGTPSCARNTGATFDYIDPVSKDLEKWRECDPLKSRLDRGAYGGPFAYIDNNANMIPDCDELRAVPMTVAMMQDAVDHAIALSGLLPRNAAGALGFAVTEGPAHGTLSGAAPDLMYTPDAGYAGNDSFTFRVSGQMGDSEPAVVAITVKATNVPPVAVDQVIRVKPDTLVGVTLAGSDADADTLGFAIDAAPLSGQLSCLMLPECVYQPEYGFTGEASFTFLVNDGIAVSMPGTVHIVVSDQPGIELLAPGVAAPATAAGALTITWTEADPGGGGVISLYRDWDGVGFDGDLIVAGIPAADSANSYLWDITGLVDGRYFVYAVIQDAGGTALAYAPGPLVIDRTGPVVSAYPAGGTYGAAQAVTLTANEAATIHFTIDGSEPTQASPVYAGAISVSESQTVRWIAVDELGNLGGQGSADYVIDTVPPAVGIDALANPLRQTSVTLSGTMEPGATVALVASATASVGQVAYPTSGAWACGVSGLLEGPITFTATATDSAGNAASAIATTVVVLNSAPVLEPIGTKSVDENLVLSFTVSATDPEGTTPAITAGALPAGAVFDGSEFTWRPGFDQAGTYTVEFTASDGSLSDVESVIITVVNVNRPPPTPMIRSPRNLARIGTLQPELVVGSVTDPDADPVTYSFVVASDSSMTQVLESATGIPPGAGGATSWMVPPLADGAWYFWRAVASDGSGASSSSPVGAFLVTASAIWTPVVISAEPPEGASVLPSVTVTATFSEPMDPATITTGSFTLSRFVGFGAVAAGAEYTVAMRNDGTVIAWGSNASGVAPAPQGLSGIVAISSGEHHSLALRSDGTVVSWGNGQPGLLEEVEGWTGITAISAGISHSLALRSDGTVVAMGDDYFGQSTVPADLSGVTAVSAGGHHSVALKGDGTVVAWGNNDSGQATVPEGLFDVVAVAAGAAHTVALKSDGTVVAWGYDGYGETVVPAGLTDVRAIAAGVCFTLALRQDGSVIGWGADHRGQTTVPEGLSGVVAIAAGWFHAVALKGDGTMTGWGANMWGEATVPPALSGTIAIAAGRDHALALRNDGRAVGWGRNDFGQTALDGLSGVTAVAGGGNHSVALREDGTVVVWGGNPFYGQAAPPTGLAEVAAIAAGDAHSLALKFDGTVVAWGNDYYSQSRVPAGLSDVAAVAAGAQHSMALISDGTVVAWGGDGLDFQVEPPHGLSDVKAIAAGGNHSAALRNDGTVVAWGRNDYGQAVTPGGLDWVTAIAAGLQHSVAVRGDGTVVAWGDNTYGQATVPLGLSNVVSVAAGDTFTVALKSDGSVVAWGLYPVFLSPLAPDEMGVEGTVTYDEGARTATFTPLAPLPPGGPYYATINAGARSVLGVPLAADVRWSFLVEADDDRDGYGASVDCNDNFPTVHPGAAEVCDGLDDDCDGLTDEGFDVDADGFTVCGGDCDDADTLVKPGAAETCNGRDDDCDELTDSADPDLAQHITAIASSGGGISPGGVVRVGCGDSSAFVISPDAGYVLVDVLVDGVSVGAPTAYVFSNVLTSHSISAFFDQPPVADAGSDQAGVVGQPLSFSGVGSSDPDGSIVSYSWDWGDGSPAGSGVNVSHSFAVTGVMTVTLTVTDDSGASAVDTLSVNIGPAVDRALGRPANASTSRNGSSYSATKAVDGDAATSWMSRRVSAGEWVRVDLGAVMSIWKVSVEWPATYYAKGFSIDTSTDGDNWTLQYTTSAGDGSATHAIFPTNAVRYVRVYCTMANSPAYYGVSALEVY